VAFQPVDDRRGARRQRRRKGDLEEERQVLQRRDRRASLDDREAGDAHGAVAWFSYVDCKSGKTKTTKMITTSKTRLVLLTQFLKNVKDVRVLLCLYQGSDDHRFCNTKGAS
jgi:hypothetical protein